MLYQNEKIGIIGGDLRQCALARRLCENGYECAVWGLPNTADIGNAVRCRSIDSAIKQSRAVILPLPATSDIYVNAPFADQKVTASALFEMIPSDSIVVGGRFDEYIKSVAKARDIPIFDICDSEEFQVKNALLTAEGAIEIALRETSFSLFDSQIILLGFGRISRAILPILKAFSREITVLARREKDIAFAEISGANAAHFSELEDRISHLENGVIFNTVPAKILTERVLEKVNESSIIIDLASGEGGTDFDFTRQRKIKAIHALALPGKAAPISAGSIVGDVVLKLLREERGDTEK